MSEKEFNLYKKLAKTIYPKICVECGKVRITEKQAIHHYGLCSSCFQKFHAGEEEV